jgi:hypothetical protein
MRPELAHQLPSAPDADGQGTAPGGRADRAFRMTVVAAIFRVHDGHGALRWPEGPRRQQPRPHAPGRRRSSWPAVRYRPAPDRPPATRYRSVVTSSPARPLPSADITRTRVSPGRDHPITTPFRAAAKTCLRRRNARLPGIICRRLQITAAMRGGMNSAVRCPEALRPCRSGAPRSSAACLKVNRIC